MNQTPIYDELLGLLSSVRAPAATDPRQPAAGCSTARPSTDNVNQLSERPGIGGRHRRTHS